LSHSQRFRCPTTRLRPSLEKYLKLKNGLRHNRGFPSTPSSYFKRPAETTRFARGPLSSNPTMIHDYIELPNESTTLDFIQGRITPLFNAHLANTPSGFQPGRRSANLFRRRTCLMYLLISWAGALSPVLRPTALGSFFFLFCEWLNGADVCLSR
jgi:hypothetical protein